MSDAAPPASQRIDQWLCFARLVKSRTLAQALIERGKVRVNRHRIAKPGLLVKPGDVLTLSMGPYVRVFEIVGIGLRRGPAPEARRLFTEIGSTRDGDVRSGGAGPPGLGAGEVVLSSPGARPAGSGRPTKRDRRQIGRLKAHTNDL